MVCCGHKLKNQSHAHPHQPVLVAHKTHDNFLVVGVQSDKVAGIAFATQCASISGSLYIGLVWLSDFLDWETDHLQILRSCSEATGTLWLTLIYIMTEFTQGCRNRGGARGARGAIAPQYFQKGGSLVLSQYKLF